MRLRQSQDFAKVFKHPVRYIDARFKILSTNNEGLGPRLGLAISKKSVKRSVDRNAVKRLIRESFRKNQEMLGNVDVVVLSKGGIASCTNEQLFKSLESHWQRLSELRRA